MEEKANTTPLPDRYTGPSPLMAASDKFFGSTLANTAGISAAWALGVKVFTKHKFTTVFMDNVRSPVMWGLSAMFAGFEAINAFGKTRRAELDYNRAYADNVAMRSQLNQTGQILRHVANQVEKGNVSDSQLAVNDDAPASHVAKLEATKAAHALASAEQKAASR